MIKPQGSVRLKLIMLCLSTAILDQLSKWIILNSISEGDVVVVIPNFFNIILTYNTGAAFGLFSNLEDGLRQLVLGLSTLLALLVITFLLFKEYKNDLHGKICLSFILGGAIGNLVDRAMLGKVVDFLDFYLLGYHWPAFNLADSAICIGVTILILRSFTHQVVKEVK
ncbi:MAG: signal peptidase II [Bdellovibrionota bacterium]